MLEKCFSLKGGYAFNRRESSPTSSKGGGLHTPPVPF
jgi:hypothetical protein